MNTLVGRLNAVLAAIKQDSKLRNRILLGIAVVAVLQIYFVRELLAAEVLFGLGFAVLFVLGVIFYFVGALGERGLDWAEAGIRVASPYVRRGYLAVEEFSKKPFRHPRSESAQ
ncbi:MAG TPA: hypothetical protein VJR23_19970 [Candidatus Acidoferrales bacterium]|nr:hypothetical protein [Candidatus Acidoferrales bacterium]